MRSVLHEYSCSTTDLLLKMEHKVLESSWAAICIDACCTRLNAVYLYEKFRRRSSSLPLYSNSRQRLVRLQRLRVTAAKFGVSECPLLCLLCPVKASSPLFVAAALGMSSPILKLPTVEPLNIRSTVSLIH
jgi:hypothetical protein